MVLRRALMLSGARWQTSTGRVVHKLTAEGNEGLAVASIARDDPSTLPSYDPFPRAHCTINSSVFAPACTATEMRGKLESKFETYVTGKPGELTQLRGSTMWNEQQDESRQRFIPVSARLTAPESVTYQTDPGQRWRTPMEPPSRPGANQRAAPGRQGL